MKKLFQWKRLFFITLTSVCFHANAFPQEPENPQVHVSGRIIQDLSIGFEEILIINQRTGRGIWGNVDGTFEVDMLKNDSLIISVRGYGREIVSLTDSAYKPNYEVEIKMKPLTITLEQPIVIRPQIKPSDIQKQQQKIGTYKRPEIFHKPIDYISSPISALYESFSKKAAEEEQYYALLNDQAAREALKDVIHYYIQNGLFYIRDDEIEQFIDFCRLPTEFIQTASLYDLGARLKDCLADYNKRHRY